MLDGTVVGTLLSPEGAELSALRRSSFPASAGSATLNTSDRFGPRTAPHRCTRGSSAAGRPYLENCTVDASIFVAKLIRAHGGCLGTRSRRRTWEAAKSPGELSTEL